MREGDPEAIVDAFIDAFNAENLDAMAAALSEKVEIHGRRGVAIGRARARQWATRRPSGSLRQRLVLDGVHHGRGRTAVAFVRRQWLWKEDGQVADEQQLAVVVALDVQGLIARWQPFDDRASALAAAGLDD
jgi:hypothetical protein